MTVPGTAVIADTFHRTVSNGWGTLDSGQVWSITGIGGSLLVSDWSITSPTGHMSVPTTSAYRISYLLDAELADVDMSATGSVTFSGGIAGGQLEILGVAFRMLSTANYYLARVEIAPGGSMTLKLIAPDAVTELAVITGVVGGLTYTTGKSLSIRIRAVGPWIKVKVWATSSAEPSTWDISINDTSTLVAGGVGLRSGVGAGNTNTKPVVFNWAEFWVSPPEVLTSSTGRPFLRALLGADAAIAFEAGFGADLAADPDTWTWTDLGSDPRHDPGVPVTIGRGDNISQAGAGSYSSIWNNAAGDYTAGNPTAAHTITQNTPIRELMTLDGTTWFIRYQGYLDSANPVTDQSARVKGVSVTALGMLGRLGGQKKPLKSPLYRAISPTSPAAWWPMEEGADSTSFASAVAGVPALAITGAVALGAAGPAGAVAAGDFAGGGSASTGLRIPIAGSFRAAIVASSTSTTVDGSSDPNNTVLCLGIAGTVGQFIEICMNSTDISIFAIDAGFANIGQVNPLPDSGPWYQIVADFTYNATFDVVNCFVSVNGVDTLAVNFTGQITTLTSVAIGTASVGSFPDGDHKIQVTALGIWTPFTGDDETFLAGACTGYTGETASDRLIRLCGEQGIGLEMRGISAVTMGPQSIDTILNLLRECEAADHGGIYDGLGPGIGYQCRTERYNASSVLTLDMGADPPQVTTFTPVFDRQAVKNLYTVSRKNGGTSAPAEQVDGPLGTALIGVEDAGPTINVDTDDVLDAHAGWLLSLGTIPGFRFPGTGLNMRGIASLAGAVLGVRIGDRITIHRPASKAVDLPPDDIDLVVEGWTETTSSDSWQLALNCSPFSPNRIATVGDTVGRIDSADSVVHTDITTTGVSLSVSGTLPWTTTATFPGDFPFDINVTGERMTVTAITGASSPQTFTVTRSVNGVVKAHLAADNEPVRVWTPLVIGL